MAETHMDTSFAPTLWRTCRVLANPRRLAILRALLNHPPQPVTQVAAACDLPFTTASQYLRLLQSRGLCRAVRTGKWVLYELHADRSVEGTIPLLSGLKRVLSSQTDDFEGIIRTLTAFTHPRRIELVAHLCGSGHQSVEDLRKKTGMSSPAIFRHVDKLVRHGLVEWREGSVRLAPPCDALAAACISIVCSKKMAG